VRKNQRRTQPPPSFAALLRLTWQQVRKELLGAIHEAGFNQFQDAHFAVFSYPLPDGVRPSELARQRDMSRQAVNYLLGQLETLGYLERRSGEDADRRLVYLTDNGWKIADAIYGKLEEIGAGWSAEIGEQRFAEFVAVLRILAPRHEVPGQEEPLPENE
jgi:DNA-binding MarR family transcriptional regulator